MNDLPIIEEEFENEQDVQDSKEFQDAARKAQSGQYDHTLLQMWEETLDIAIRQAQEPLSLVVANSLLKQWPWLSYADLDIYLQERLLKLQEARKILTDAYPVPRDELFDALNEYNVDDWAKNSDAYIDVIVGWTRLCKEWENTWETISLVDPIKGIAHAVIADVTSQLLHTQNGLVENVRNLAGFEFSPEMQEEVQTRIEADDE